jgi:hypothetical protein
MRRLAAVLATLIAMSISAAEPQIDAERLRPFVGEFEGSFEQRLKKDEWTTSSVSLSGRPIVSGRYVEFRGTFDFAGFEKPMELVMLWSWDPFQKEYRLAVLDDYAGLLDVFEQKSASPLQMSNVSHGTFFQDGRGRNSWSTLTVHFLEDGALRMHLAASTDGGTTWLEISRFTLRRTGK